MTDTTITIGATVVEGEAALASSLGISGASTVSTQDIYEAIVDDINQSGGVLGRTLEVYYHKVDLATFARNPAQTYAEACTDFRDDHPVFAVLTDAGVPALRQCLADMGSVLWLIDGLLAILPEAAYTQNGGSLIYGIDAITVERLAELFIQSLMDRSFTEPWNTVAGGPGALPAKLGAIHADSPDTNAQYAAYEAELGKHGFEYAEEVTYPENLQNAVSTTSSAVLRFRSAGITHVFGASVFFMQIAESQGYRPRYAYLPRLGTIGVDNAPPGQMKGALTVGWTPMSDVKAAQDPGDTPGAPACRAVMEAHGLNPGSRRDQALMYRTCDGMYSLRDALAAAQDSSVGSLRQGFESLGTGFATAATFGVSVGPSRHHGVDAVSDLAFDSACRCLVYE